MVHCCEYSQGIISLCEAAVWNPFCPGNIPAYDGHTTSGHSRCDTYIDDILVTGPSDEEHFKALDETLSRLDKAGLWAQLKKCKFMMSSVDYLGF